MSIRIFLYFFFFQAAFTAQAKVALTNQQISVLTETLSSWWSEASVWKSPLLEGEVVSWSDVSSTKDQQTMLVKVAGLHARTCSFGLRKISRYENYKDLMSFVKESTFVESEQKVHFLLDHTVLPYPMVLDFKLPRITDVGHYPFTFPNGIFKNLHGTIHVSSVGPRCLYFLEAKWVGASTKIPNLIVETFAQTLTKIGLEHMIRFSSL